MLWESENRAEQCRILQIGTIDTGNGTLFGTENRRAIQRDHLTLVIGSGGMGAEAIHAAVQKARQNLESDFDNYTKFIMVDSDWCEILKNQIRNRLHCLIVVYLRVHLIFRMHASVV